MMLKILVVGAGAIGCFVGGRLAGVGHDVTLLGRAPLLNKIKADGLCLQHPTQPEQIVNPHVIVSLAEASTSYDFILISVKSPDTDQVITDLQTADLSLINTHVVSLQNGIGNEEKMAETFGRKHVIAGTITIPISVPEQGTIVVSKDKGGLGLAALEPNQPVPQLAQALAEAGLTTPVYPNYQAMKWSKLLLNIVNNASSAILDEAPAKIIKNTDLFNMEIRALQEGVAVMKAMGFKAVKLPGYPTDWLARLVSAAWLPMVAQRAILRPFMVSGRGTKMPSLHIDLAGGRPDSEISVLNGAIVAAGQQVGLATPVNQALTNVLTAITTGQVAWDEYRHQPDKLWYLIVSP